MKTVFAIPLLLTVFLAPSALAEGPRSDNPAIQSRAVSAAVAAACGPGGPWSCRASGLERQPITEDIAWYRFDVQVGAGVHEAITLHRIVKESSPWRPERSSRSIFLAHGDRWGFAATYLTSLLTDTVDDRQNLAVFLAEQGIDVWGLDFRWARVDGDTTDLSFMADWGLATDASDLGIGLAVARWTRLVTGNGFRRIHLAGFSRGGQAGYVHLNAESQRPRFLRNTAGFVVLDIGIKSDDPGVSARACERYDDFLATFESGQVSLSTDVFQLIADLALTAPEEPSPFFELFTNRQIAIDFGAGGYPDRITPFFHAVAGLYDGDGFPLGLTYADEQHFFAQTRAQAIHQPIKILLEAEALLCDTLDSPLDDHLGDVTVPILYVGAGGGFGEFGPFSTTLLGSTDVSQLLIDFEPPENRTADYGHWDLLLADNAESLVWQPILSWLLAR